ncbi:peptidyl-tRNA hydrolase 2 mitochondrial [Tripterygium wilfordii]|uniref:peptidyl-tRNA hydrolase n=1 Tax=Tripterygium wilfordii TaxID=458696 RepID=A0A7J7DPJ1_TRIWF|nr:peptidyl-tRNA hydrolase 2, mitochondrial isoform X3 [Tripterygium wilfordii]KAF5748268.1 peptidyl-tRNA hydrolase 2 mitochondrial [Tripterygium wilfordii]
MGNKSSQPSNKKQEKEWLTGSFRPENFIPGLIIGFISGLLFDLLNPPNTHVKKRNFLSGKFQPQQAISNNGDQEMKMVLVVRQDLKMGSGKIASQCAHAATGMYVELMQSHRSLLRQWEQCGQPKIVVTCKNQPEMNKLKDAAQSIGLPTFMVADAGRTQVSAGSKTVLAVGPGPKASVDSVTGKLRLL